MRKLILSVFMSSAMAIGLVSAIPAHADADTVITVTIKNHPDNGHGSPSHWADTTFVRTVIIHPVDDKFSVTVKDAGTLVTRKGTGSPNSGIKISRKLPGTYTSIINHGLVTGTLNANKVNDMDGNVYDDKNGNASPSTGSWSKALFNAGATGGDITTYQFLYKTADETWNETTENNDGTDDSAGDITGKLTSKLTFKNWCRISKTDKHNRWSVSNVQGDRSRTFSYWVRYAGKYSAHFSATVAPGGTIVITTPYGGRGTVSYWDGYAVNKRLYAWSKAATTC